MTDDVPRIAILGGSGIYDLTGLADVEAHDVDTPFGKPSDRVRVGRLGPRRVAFLARHGREHRLLPSEINYRANLFALKRLGVERVLSASAVGSLEEHVRPRDVVLVDQFVDATRGTPPSFFGDGIAAHVSLADPVCPELRQALAAAARGRVPATHDRGTYLCISGPAFSTRAESRLYRSWGVQVIGMTNAHEARLAREAELCYATLALVTDYDCWHAQAEDVSVSGVLDNLRANASAAAAILRAAIEALPLARAACACGEALAQAILTPPEQVPLAARERLAPIVARYLERPPTRPA